jgi:hypothetical protein
MEFKDNAWNVSGDISETFDMGTFGIPGGKVTFDFTALRVINSGGVRAWVQGLNKLDITPIYRNCPASIVMLFNMIPEFLGKHGRVESIQVPTYCSHCGNMGSTLLHYGKDFEAGKPVQLKGLSCTRPECTPEADVDTDSYFYFVEHVLKP